MEPIFCPQCGDLVLDAASCPACGWQRPPAAWGGGEPLWQAEVGHRLPKPYSYPAIVGDHLCLAGEDGALVALALARGEPVWEQALGEGEVALALASDGASLFVGPMDGRSLPRPGRAFRALDGHTGEERWRVATGAHSLSAGVLGGESLFFTASDGRLLAVEAASGAVRWTVAHPGWGPAPPAATEAGIVAGGRCPVLVAYDAADGNERWRFEAAGWFATRPQAEEGRVYALCWDGTLFALDAASGAEQWRYRGERGQGLSSPPVVAGGRLVIGSRVNPPEGAPQGPRYALLALDGRDGREQWRFPTERHVRVPPIVAGNTVLFGADDGSFYALDAASGHPLWQVALGARPLTQPQVAGDQVIVAEREGGVYAFRWRAPAATPLPPERYLARGEPEQAAIAHALHGDLAQAAALYEAMGRPREAGLLLERAGQLPAAARLLEQAGEPRRARELYRAAADWGNLARLLAATGEPLEAAQLYEAAGEWDTAAPLYERAGNRLRAADLYQQGGQTEQAQAIWRSLGAWEREVAQRVEVGQLAEAARLLAAHGQAARAADLFEQAEQYAEALALRVALGQWENVALLAAWLGDWEQKARAHEALAQLHLAARAYERAAQHAASATPTNEARVGALYEQALRLYDDTFDRERAAACRQALNRLRRLPELVVQGEAQKVFIEREWNTLRLRVKNRGFGVARNVEVRLRGPFNVQEAHLPGLGAQAATTLDVYLQPRAGEVGPRVPLEIVVAYEDVEGTHYAGAERIPVRVLPQGSATGADTPSTILGLLGRPVERAAPSEPPLPDLGVLHAVLLRAFNLEELALLCQEVSARLARDGHAYLVDMERVGGSGKEGKIANLIAYLARRQVLGYLVEAMRHARPNERL